MPNLLVPETSWGPASFGLNDRRYTQAQMAYAARRSATRCGACRRPAPPTTPATTSPTGPTGSPPTPTAAPTRRARSRHTPRSWRWTWRRRRRSPTSWPCLVRGGHLDGGGRRAAVNADRGPRLDPAHRGRGPGRGRGRRRRGDRPARPVWRRVTGSERLSLLRDGGPGPGGSDVAAELA